MRTDVPFSSCHLVSTLTPTSLVGPTGFTMSLLVLVERNGRRSSEADGAMGGSTENECVSANIMSFLPFADISNNSSPSL